MFANYEITFFTLNVNHYFFYGLIRDFTEIINHLQT